MKSLETFNFVSLDFLLFDALSSSYDVMLYVLSQQTLVMHYKRKPFVGLSFYFVKDFKSNINL